MIFLRELTREDIPTINNWRQSRDLQDFFASPFRYINIETDEEWFNNYMKSRNTQVRLSICLKETNEIIGMASLVDIDRISRKAVYGGIMLGHANHRMKGIGKEVTKLLLSHAFLDLNLHRVQGLWLLTNHASIKMGEACGFKREGVLRNAAYKNGEYVDLLLMAILRPEFDLIKKNRNPQSPQKQNNSQ